MRRKEPITILLTIITLSFLVGCATPRTYLKNSKTGQVVYCGGDISSSATLGAIGYHMQKKIDQECVRNLEANGYKVQETVE